MEFAGAIHTRRSARRLLGRLLPPAAVALTLCLLAEHAVAAPRELRIINPTARVVQSALVWQGWLLVRGDSDRPERVAPVIEAAGARAVEILPASAEATARQSALFAFKLTMQGADASRLRAGLPGYPQLSADCPLRPAIDLSALAWEAWWAGAKSTLAGSREPPPPTATWRPVRLPKLWEELGITWVRCRATLPAAWRGKPLQLDIGAVDDNDATFFNGRRIGTTHGWDVPRHYRIPADNGLVRWDQPNEICIAVENIHAGGGVYRLPIELRPADGTPAEVRDGLRAAPAAQDEGRRPRPQPLGARRPLRPMAVADGILRYADGGEVALWGVNYYPQSWVEYESLKKLGVDPRRAIDQDLDDLQRIGIDIIRIHVFDSEISKLSGDLVRNDHLDVLDYLVSQCTARGLYLMLTPIAWWSSPSARSDSFSQNTPKQGMTLWPAAWPAQANYVRQFLAHENPYTKRRLVDEPCLVLFEVINEPNYWSAAEVLQNDAGWLGGTRRANVPRAQEGVRQAWRALVPGEDWNSPQGYALYRYETLRRYIDTMVAAIRSTGARQPIAYFANPWGEVADVFGAIADSRCDAITLGTYPGGLPQQPSNDQKNLLGAIWPKSVDARLAQKARLCYEFDAAGTLHRVSMYPAIARHWRELGVQVACQFQYDPRATAHLNWDWPQHYLNLWYTPEKMASFLIGGETFRRLARGTRFELGPDEQVFAPAAVSFPRNAAVLSAADCYIQAGPTAWRPLPLPAHPQRIVSVGNCPFFDYPGTGLVDLRIDGPEAHLQIYPDVDRLRDDLLGTLERPLARLASRPHAFRLRLAEWDHFTVERESDGCWTDVSVGMEGFTATAGQYRLKRKETSPSPPGRGPG